MTEIEKLRALLAEARPILWLHRPAGDMDCDCRECSAVVEVVARIDAALAEPVQNYEALYRTNVRCECGDYDACLLTRQRDEARKYAKERNDEANKLQRFLNMAAQERDEARAEIERLKTESPSGDMKTDVAEQRQVRGK